MPTPEQILAKKGVKPSPELAGRGSLPNGKYPVKLSTVEWLVEKPRSNQEGGEDRAMFRLCCVVSGGPFKGQQVRGLEWNLGHSNKTKKLEPGWQLRMLLDELDRLNTYLTKPLYKDRTKVIANIEDYAKLKRAIEAADLDEFGVQVSTRAVETKDSGGKVISTRHFADVHVLSKADFTASPEPEEEPEEEPEVEEDEDESEEEPEPDDDEDEEPEVEEDEEPTFPEVGATVSWEANGKARKGKVKRRNMQKQTVTVTRNVGGKPKTEEVDLYELTWGS